MFPVPFLVRIIFEFLSKLHSMRESRVFQPNLHTSYRLGDYVHQTLAGVVNVYRRERFRRRGRKSSMI